ncbi:MAG: hypothetical protein ACXAEX_24155 [Promethearchaeota archaeon]|jgi:hypothetical protein
MIDKYSFFMRNERDYCFGQRSSTTWGLIIGVVIILAGLIELFGDSISWLDWDNIWPFFLIIIGLLVVGNVFYKR